MVTFIPAKDDWADAFRKIGSGVTQGYMNRSDENAVRKAIADLGPNASARDILSTLTNVKTYGNEAKQEALKNYLGVENFEELKRKAQAQEEISREKNRVAAMGKKTEADVESLKASLIADGMPDYEADLYVQSPPGVQQRIQAAHIEAKARGLRQPISQNQSEQAAPGTPGGTPTKGPMAEVAQNKEIPLPVEEALAPVDEAIEKTVEAVEEPPVKQKDEWPEIPPPPRTTPAEQEKWRDKNQAFNNKLLKEAKEKGNSHTNALIRYNRLSSLNNSKKLPEGMGRLVINPETGEPYAVASLLGLVNKETQDFVKTMNDFMIDAKNYFGSRVTNFDVQAFKSRLPTLLNTPDGRRLIIEQMKLMEELQIVHDTELEKGLKHYGRNASYSDIQNVVDERTTKKETEIINKINNLDQAANYLDLMASDPKFKDTTLMQSPQGKFKAVPNSKVSDAKSKGYISW